MKGALIRAPLNFGKWIIDSALQEAKDADDEMGVRTQQASDAERFEFNSPSPLDLQSAAIVNAALSRAEKPLEQVVGEQELPEGAGADFTPAPCGPTVGVAELPRRMEERGKIPRDSCLCSTLMSRTGVTQ